MFKSRNISRRRTAAAEPSPEVKPIDDNAAAPIDEPTPGGSMNPFSSWPKSALEDVISSLSKYAEDKGVLDSIQMIAEEIRKRPEDVVEPTAPKTANVPPTNEETMDPLEGYIKEITEAHAEVEPPPVDGLPATVLPGKLAAEMTAAKAAKLGASVAEKLKSLFLEAKPITSANESRPVRNAVDAIYAAYQQFGEAVDILEKQDRQEKEEASAQEAMMNRAKKSSTMEPEAGEQEPTNDKVASRKRAEVADENAKTQDAEEEADSKKASVKGRSLLANLITAAPVKTAARATRKDRAEFARLLSEHAPKAQSKEVNEHTVASIAEDLMRYGSSYNRILEFKGSPETMDPKYVAKEEEIRTKIQGLCTQLGVAPIYGTDPRTCTVKVSCPDRFTNDHDRQGICVPTA
jgi:hypothetical protein